ncbi:histone-lysine N-methyltransferase SETMAR [Aricia agestis]|uniref:histone-lysine N-methyltransferase SETMAR n=1 Tax=Aricia agestis TaxID=91739 RepID=UPI001C20A1F3|nr:histone-lysine N-methyltransferase SETMAR [Aricia agestis]
MNALRENEGLLHSYVSTLVYVDESIPGPSDESEDYKNILSEYNSQVTHSCDCSKCVDTSCKCLQQSGGVQNYILDGKGNIGAYKLNTIFDVNSGFIKECNDLCSCSEYCGNRLVQKGPIDCLMVQSCKNSLKGLGLITCQAIHRGTFICEYAGELLTRDQAIFRNNLNQQSGKMNYIFCLQEHCNGKTLQTFIDPSYIGNIGRYINHSCEPNCKIIPVRVNSMIPKLAIFSSEDILPGTELTFDYGCTSNIFDTEQNVCRKVCLCGSPSCRGIMPFNTY